MSASLRVVYIVAPAVKADVEVLPTKPYRGGLPRTLAAKSKKNEGVEWRPKTKRGDGREEGKRGSEGKWRSDPGSANGGHEKDLEWRAETTLANGRIILRSSNDPDGGKSGKRLRPGSTAEEYWDAQSEDRLAFLDAAACHRRAMGYRLVPPVRPHPNNPQCEWGVEVRSRLRDLEKEKSCAREERDRRRCNLDAKGKEEIALRRLMKTTVKRLRGAVNEVIDEEGAGRRMATGRDLRAGFRQFMQDSRGDKGLNEPWAYRTWLWTDRNTVYLAPAGMKKSGGKGAGGRVTGSGKP